MSTGDRLKMLRKDLKLTQSEFAKKICLKQASIGLIENNTRNLTDRSIMFICDVFGVSEEWLRYGKGEMYRKSNPDNNLAIEIAKLISSDDNWTKNAVLQLLKLPPHEREIIKKFTTSLFVKNGAE